MNLSSTFESRPKCTLITDNFPPKGGGVSRYYAGLASSYGTAMQVCSPQTRNSNAQGEHPSLPAATNRRGQLNQAFAAARIFRRTESIVLLGHPHLGLILTLMPRSHPVGLIIHGGEWQEFERLQRLLYAVEARCDFIIANSWATARDWLDSRLADKVVILRPGLDNEWIAKGSAAASAEQSCSSRHNPFRLLTVARLVPRKGISETARVVADLRQQGQDVELRIVGDGPLLPELRHSFESDPAIRFLGALSDEELQSSYEWADAFVLCPHTTTGGEGYEGFGIVYLEAAAYGLPIVATVSGGVAEALDPLGSLTTLPHDWATVSDNLRRLISMPRADLSNMREANLRWARHNSWERRSDELASSLKERMSCVGR